jgi:hypothetical protein
MAGGGEGGHREGASEECREQETWDVATWIERALHPADIVGFVLQQSLTCLCKYFGKVPNKWARDSGCQGGCWAVLVRIERWGRHVGGN